jgi:hypothetical protein
MVLLVMVIRWRDISAKSVEHVNSLNEIMNKPVQFYVRVTITMKPKLILCLAFVLSGGLLLTGCRGMGTQQFTAFAPAQSHELESSSRIVLDVICTQLWEQADYNLRENLSMLAPQPKQWKFDMTLQVERVVKGEFDDKTLQLHWLREPTKEQYESLGISPSAFLSFTNGTPLRIGFDGRSGDQLKNLKIMVR